MTRRLAYKKVHYVRANYPRGIERNTTLEQNIRDALDALPTVASTEITTALGVVSIRQRRSTDHFIKVSLGAGKLGEQASTLGIGVADIADADEDSPAPDQRAFKNADCFILVEDDDLLIINDGEFSTPKLQDYLQELLLKSLGNAGLASFVIRKVTNLDKYAILEREGIKEIQLNTTMYQATQYLDAPPLDILGKVKYNAACLWNNLTKEELDPRRDEHLAQELAAVQVSTTIKAIGGSTAQEIVLNAIEVAGREALTNDDAELGVVVITRKGTPISMSDVTPQKNIRFHRRALSNDLPINDVFTRLAEYRTELIGNNQWKP